SRIFENPRGICEDHSLRRTPFSEKLRPGRLRAYFGNLFTIKNKRAALGRRSGKHCGRHKSSGSFQGAPGNGSPEAYSLFVRLLELCVPQQKLSSRAGKE